MLTDCICDNDKQKTVNKQQYNSKKILQETCFHFFHIYFDNRLFQVHFSFHKTNASPVLLHGLGLKNKQRKEQIGK